MNSKQRLFAVCVKRLKELGLDSDKRYQLRFRDEMIEIDVQDQYEYFISHHDQKHWWNENENNLLIPYLLDLCPAPVIDNEPKSVMGEFPDIDVDYLSVVRDYLRNEYAPKVFGKEKVCNIGTFSTYHLKQAIQDMARIFGADRNEAIRVTKQFGMKDEEGETLTWDAAIKMFPDFKAWCEKYPEVADAAKHLHGRIKSIGQHAGGFIVSDRELSTFVPLVRAKDGGSIVTAWTEGQTAQDLQPVGLIKFDFLAIKTWQQIVDCIALIKDRHPEINSLCAVDDGPHWSDDTYLNNPKSIAMANRGDLRFVFQFDSPGIRSMVKAGGVTSFNDLVAYSSLYRPGPMGEGMHDEYTSRKRGQDYTVHPKLKPLLEETYGVLCLQEKTFVTKTDGSASQIKRIRRGDNLYSMDVDNKRVEPDLCMGCGPTRVANGVRIKLTNGYQITVTPDHEILTQNGYKAARDLRLKDDLVAVAHKYPKIGEESFPDVSWLGTTPERLAYFMGMMVHSGYMKYQGKMRFLGGEVEHLKKFYKFIDRRLPKLKIKPNLRKRSIEIDFALKTPRKDKTVTTLRQLFDEFDLERCIRWRIIPTKILTAPLSIRAAFLAGVMDTSVAFSLSHKYEKRFIIRSRFRNLHESLRQMLTAAGSTVSMSANQKMVYVQSRSELTDAARRYFRIRQPRKIRFSKGRGDQYGYAPAKEVIDVAATIEGGKDMIQNAKEVASMNKTPYMPYSVAKSLGMDFKDMRFIKIRNIRNVYDKVFYSISVRKNHNLIANGIVVKNCYQEDIMRVLNTAGSIPMRDGYTIIKAISKKKADKFEKYKHIFINHCQRNLAINEEESVKLWNQIESFAEYGFNKSHSCAYSVVSARQLYLKANYPVEFFCSMLTHIGGKDKDTKLRDCIRIAAQSGVKVKPIDINLSDASYTIHCPTGVPTDQDVIYFGFSNLKSFPNEAAERIAQLRKQKPFEGFEDFLRRFGPDKKVVETLLALGHFDDADPVTLYRYFMAYRGHIKRASARDKNVEKRIEMYREKLFELTGVKIKGEITLTLLDSLRPKQLDRVTIKQFNLVKGNIGRTFNKMSESENREDFPSLDDFENEDATPIPEKLMEMFNDRKKAELAFYGFSWTSPLDAYEDVQGYTVEAYEAAGYAQKEPGPIEGRLNRVMEMTAKKRADFKYYLLMMSDDNWCDYVVHLWAAEYERFKDRLIEGRAYRLQVFPPDWGDKFTLESYPPYLSRKIPPLDRDFRVVELQCKQQNVV